MEDEIDLLINMAGWWSYEPETLQEFLIVQGMLKAFSGPLCPSAWSVDLEPEISKIVSDNFFNLLA